MTTTDLRYPIGPVDTGVQVTRENLPQMLLDIAELPDKLRDAIEGLSEDELNSEYRPGGWTVRQVVHHLADSHMNWYIRTRLALTENEPTIKPYDENLWAALRDAKTGPVEPSLLLLDGLHIRMVRLLESTSEADWSRKFVHPELGLVTVGSYVPIYAWHGRHHVAHITALRKRMGWM